MTDKTLPPEWAFRKACDVIAYRPHHVRSMSNSNPVRILVEAHAALIAEHEQEPVDPLLAKAREIAAQHFESADTDFALRCAKDLRDGKSDNTPTVQLVLRTLRAAAEEK